MDADPTGAATRIEVLVFAGLKAAAGRERVEVELPHSVITVAQLRQAMLVALPQARELILASRFAIDQAFVEDSMVVKLGLPADASTSASPAADETESPPSRAPATREIALIPPVSGGHDGAIPSGSAAQSRTSAAALSHGPLELAAAQESVRSLAAGALASFEGTVREHSRGLIVTHLEYEAYPAMALRVMESIIADIERQHVGARVAIHHRLGRLELGETAVIIVAAAPHRAEAFAACREAIERLKADVPIWKKEFDAQGGTWISQGP